jgi:hypothetical protein
MVLRVLSLFGLKRKNEKLFSTGGRRMTYPDGIDALINVNADQTLAAGGHAARHNSVNTALGEVKDFLGTGTGYRYNSTVYFTSNGTFTKATYPWLRAIRVQVVGGGGGGGGAGATSASQVSFGNGGSGSGYAESFITDIAGLSASVTVTVGGGGTGGGGASTGSNGGNSSFASSVAANGGQGGTAEIVSAAVPGFPSAGSDATAGDIQVRGAAGGYGLSTQVANFCCVSGKGADGPFGNGGRSVRNETTGTAGQSASGFGAGGGGATNSVNQSNRSGGNGGGGLVVVELYA